MTITINTGGSETAVDETQTANQGASSVSALPDGGYVVVWQTSVLGQAGNTVYAQRFDSSGAKVGAEILVGSSSTFGADPVVAALTGGGFAVTWTGEDNQVMGVHARLYDASGAPQTGDVLVNSTQSGGQTTPTITALTDGGYLIAWQGQGNDPNNPSVYNICTQRFSSTGAAVGGEVEVNPMTQFSATGAVLASLSGGGYVLAWASQDTGLNIQRYDNSGTKVGAVYNAPFGTNLHSATNVQLVGLTGGGFAMAWTVQFGDFGPGGGSGSAVYMQRFAADGSLLGVETRVNTYVIGDQFGAKLAALSDGGFIVTWTSMGQDGSGGGVYAQRYSASGTPLGGETLINITTEGNQANPAVAGLADGSFVVTWDASQSGGTNQITQIVSGGGVISSTLGTAVQTAVGDGADDTFLAAPNALNPGDVIDGGAGADRIQLTSAGTADFTGVAISRVELIQGSSGADTVIFASAPPAGVAFDTGGGNDTLLMNGRVDLGQLSLTGSWTLGVASGANAVFALSSPSQAAMISGALGDLTVDSSAAHLDAAQRALLFAAGVDRIDQPRGLVFEANGEVFRDAEARTSDGAFRNAQSSIGATSDGGYVIAWARDDDPFGVTDDDVWAQRYDRFGRRVGDAFRVNTTRSSTQDDAQAAGLTGGGFVIAWTSLGQGESGGSGNIYAQRYNDQGQALGGETLVNTDPSGDQRDPAIVALTGGGYVITWDTAQGAVRYQVFDSTGNKVGGETTVSSSPYSQVLPAAAALANGGFAIAWQGVDDSSQGVLVQRFDANGVSLGAAAVVNTTQFNDQTSPAIVGLAGGGFAVTWTVIDGNNGFEVMFQLFDSSGAKVGSEASANTTQAGAQLAQAMTAMPDGGFIVTWMSTATGTQSIVEQRFDATGARVGPEVTVAAVGLLASIATLSSGAPVVGWTEQFDFGQQDDVFHALRTPIDYHQLTSAADTIGAASINMVVEFNAADLNAGDSLSGGAGVDTLMLIAPGTVDLTAPSTLTAFEVVLGSTGADTFVLTNARVGAFLIDGDTGSDILSVASSGLFDMTPMSLANLEQVNFGAGDDLIVLPTAGPGGATFNGGAGVDRLSFANASTAMTLTMGSTALQSVGAFGSLAMVSVEGVIGSAFNDTFVAATGNYSIDGGLGADTASYASANVGVTVNLSIATAQNTGVGQQTLISVENLVGTTLADILIGDAGANQLHGGWGDDVLSGGLGDDLLDGDFGTDAASYASAGAGVTVNLSTTGPQNTGGAGIDTLVSVEVLLGSDFNDTLIGDPLTPNILIGGWGDDILTGDSGDFIDGGPGNDTMSGGTVSYDGAAGAVTVSLALAGPQNTVGAGIDTLSNFFVLIGSAFDDNLVGDAGTNFLFGGAGADFISGGGGLDGLAGEDGNDILVGGSDTDSLNGGAGSDVLYGLAGDDLLFGGGHGADGADYLFGGAGDDIYYVNSDLTGPLDLVFEGGSNPDLMAGVDDYDVIISEGRFFWDFYSVAEEIDIADNPSGVAYLVAGKDVTDKEIYGSNGTDLISTYGHNATVNAGNGTDAISFNLYGLDQSYRGHNTVVMGPASGIDYVYDFLSGTDHIDLRLFAFGITGAQVLAQAVDVDNPGTADDYCYFYLTNAGGVQNFIVFIGLLSSQLQAGDFIT